MIHRHLQVPEGTAPEDLPLAAVADLLERGDLDDWRPLLLAIGRDPFGELADAVKRIVDTNPMYGTSVLFRAWIDRSQFRAEGRRDGANRPKNSLRGIRLERGETQVAVAERAGMSQSDYSKLERRRDLQVSTLARVASLFGARLRLVFAFPEGEVELDADQR